MDDEHLPPATTHPPTILPTPHTFNGIGPSLVRHPEKAVSHPIKGSHLSSIDLQAGKKWPLEDSNKNPFSQNNSAPILTPTRYRLEQMR